MNWSPKQVGDGHHRIGTSEGKLFLYVVLDLLSKLAIGWSVILHSDCGSQFRSSD